MENVTQLGKSGRITIPAKMRAALGVKTGDEVLIRLENGTIRMIPLGHAIRLAQRRVKKYVPEGVSLVEELIRSRREEVARE